MMGGSGLIGFLQILKVEVKATQDMRAVLGACEGFA